MRGGYLPIALSSGDETDICTCTHTHTLTLTLSLSLSLSLSIKPFHPGEFGCVAKGQLCTDRRDAMGGSRGVVMKMIIGECVDPSGAKLLSPESLVSLPTGEGFNSLPTNNVVYHHGLPYKPIRMG